MLERLRAKRPGTPLHHLLLYLLARFIMSWVLRVLYHAHGLGGARIPPHGAVLLVANHQSYLDPPLVGACVPERIMDFVARQGLFKNWFMRLVSTPLNCIPIREDGNDPAAIKEILKRLGEGRAVLIFPEGTRTHDGGITHFKRGAAVLVRRARCPVVPVALEGAFDAWPRHAKRPLVRGMRLSCAFGRPISQEDLFAQGGDAAMDRLEREVGKLRQVLRRRMRRQTHGRFPPRGPGDRDHFDVPRES